MQTAQHNKTNILIKYQSESLPCLIIRLGYISMVIQYDNIFDLSNIKLTFDKTSLLSNAQIKLLASLYKRCIFLDE
jgi:hypothetical protein